MCRLWNKKSRQGQKKILEYISVGWSYFWRFSIFYRLPFRYLENLIKARINISNNILLKWSFVVAVVGVAITIMLDDYLAKRIIKIKYGFKIKVFVGWKVYWKIMVGYLCLILIIIIGLYIRGIDLSSFLLNYNKYVFEILFAVPEIIIAGWVIVRVYEKHIETNKSDDL